ncbi:ABC transporter permease [Ramlibacter sp. G-1-2-2]|uniref:ABC transporter permease n=1 Tax=Ramlibacter agri TaxID=2728837 RepID=A0A848HGQ6_9BURK|nr:ABC transporter permease [Ramlibacter agri]NML47713.1 ABC transporter permease [Ramlibacter agri]
MAAGFLSRFAALLRKEVRQLLRDRSNLAVGLLLPGVLILLFGYGLSFDVKNAPVAVVLEDRSPTARDVVSGLQGSAYLAPNWVASMAQAERLMLRGEVVAIVRVPADFSRQLAGGKGRIQVILNGVDSNTASAVSGYISGALATWGQRQADRAGGAQPAGGVQVEQRMWFNETGDSTWYFVPGLVVLIMTLMGAFLTSMLIAREWERGTLEALFVTPVRPLELVLAKLLPYFAVGAIDLALCLLAAKYLFHVPMRGSLWLVVASSLLYLLVSLALGLFISGATRNQFQASQVALLVSFMPAMMLSGFVFDLRNVPLVIQGVSRLLPATHFMGLIKTLFLAGDNWGMVLRSCLVLALYALLLVLATRRTLRKKLD